MEQVLPCGGDLCAVCAAVSLSFHLDFSLCVFLTHPTGTWLPPNTPAHSAIHHPRFWGESSSEHLVTFIDSPADLLALFYAWGNLKMCLIIVGKHIRKRRTPGTTCQHQQNTCILFYLMDIYVWMNVAHVNHVGLQTAKLISFCPSTSDFHRLLKRTPLLPLKIFMWEKVSVSPQIAETIMPMKAILQFVSFLLEKKLRV